MIPGESVRAQYRLMVVHFKWKMGKEKKHLSMLKANIKWLKLKNDNNNII